MPRHRHPAEYRAHAVELWKTSGKSQRAVALELGISNEQLTAGSAKLSSTRAFAPTAFRPPSGTSCAGSGRRSATCGRSVTC